jgi:hypothetical protein
MQKSHMELRALRCRINKKLTRFTVKLFAGADYAEVWVQNPVQNPFTSDQIDLKYGHRWQVEANGCMTQALQLQDFMQHRVAPQK